MNLVEALTQQARARPDAAAIIESRQSVDRAITFAELERRSATIAALLRRSGLQPGDPVLILHPVSAELYAILLAVFRLGAVAVFLDPSAGRAHLERCCELQAPRALIASPKAHLLRVVSGALRRIPLKFVVGSWLPGAISIREADRLAPLEGWEPCAPEAHALLTFTSGSTGLPKAAVRTHGFLLAQHRVLECHIKLKAGEMDLATLPVFVLANLASGLTTVLPDADLRAPGAIQPKPVLSQIARLGITRVAASPAFLERLLGIGFATTISPLAGLKKIYTGGAPVFPRLLDRLQAAAPSAEIEAVYGSTEAEPIAHLESRELSVEDRAAILKGNGLPAGRPIPEIQLRIIRDQWGQPLGRLTAAQFVELAMPPDEIGEIVVSGEHVLTGYLQGRGDDETKFRVEQVVWHRTGDAGKLDHDGRLWLQGRCAAKVQDDRGVLYPFAVECVVAEHEAVKRSAFVAHSNRRLLAIEPGEGFTPAICEALGRELEWASVDEVFTVTRLPVDPRHNAKIDYPALRRMLEDRMSRRGYRVHP